MTEKKTAADTMVDVAYRNIRRDITEDLANNGEKLNLSELCARYSISATPIKQALNRLIAEGLVENVPGRGFRVREFDWRAIDETFELRLMMELYYAPMSTAAVKNSSMLRQMFEKNIRENFCIVQDLVTMDDFLSAYQLDKGFHELFIQAGGNSSALRIYHSLNTHSYALYLYGKQPAEQTVRGIMEHQEQYEAMLAGDTDKVCGMVKTHVENARKKIRLFMSLGDRT